MWISRLLTRFYFSQERNTLYSISQQVKDVVKIKGYTDKLPYIVIEGERIDLPPSTYAGNIKVPSKNCPIMFYDTHFNLFTFGTPVLRMLVFSFFIKIQDDYYYVINNELFIKPHHSLIYASTQGSKNLQPIVCQTLSELESSQTIDRQNLHNQLMKNIINRSQQLKTQKLLYKQIMKVVDTKIKILDQHIKVQQAVLEAKANKRVKYFTSFVIAQAAILHYFIYFNLSWDIMEPITVILANIDLLIAYYYFLIKGKNYSPQNWKNSIVQAKRYRHLTKQGIDVQKYEQYNQIRDYLRMRLGLLSKSPLVVLDTVEKPIKMLDIR